MSEPHAHRPTPVTVIGWVWTAIGVLLLARSVVNLILWRAIRPAFPLLSSMAVQRAGGRERMNLLFAHFTAFSVAQAILAIALVVVSWGFLRLRSWARRALRVVCVLALIYVVAFAGLLVAAWTGAFPGPSLHAPALGSRRGAELTLMLALCMAFAAGLAAMTAALGSAPVMEAFRRASPPGHAAVPD